MNKQASGVKGNKKQLTYAFMMNADGSKKLPPVIIGKFEKPQPFQQKLGAQLGFYYQNNAKAWMTTVLYQEWLGDWDVKLQREGQKIILFQDNFSAHIPPNNLKTFMLKTSVQISLPMFSQLMQVSFNASKPITVPVS